MPDVSQQHIVVCGGGIQGMATAVAFLERGYKVTVLESEEKLGLGLSWRQDFNQYGIVHSGAFFEDNMRAQVCADMYKLLRQPREQDDVLMRLFRNHFIQTEKLIVARSDDGDLEKLHAIAEKLERRGMARGGSYDWVDLPEELNALNEPIVTSDNTRAVIRLKEVGILHIGNYIEALRQYFVDHGGELKFSHNVVDIKVATQATKELGTGVVCATPDGQVIISGDAVVNCAGLSAGIIAEKAAAAVAQSESTTKHPVNPTYSYGTLAVLRYVGPESRRPVARRLSYFSGNADDTSVGAHIYLSQNLGSGLFSTTIGPFGTRSTTRDNVGDRETIPFLEMNEDIIRKAKKVLPNFNPADWVLELGGGTHHAYHPLLPHQGQRDYIIADCYDENIGLTLRHSFTFDTPGVTSNVVWAHRHVRDIHDYLSGGLAPAVARRVGPPLQTRDASPS